MTRTLSLLLIATLLGCASSDAPRREQLVGRPPVELPDPGPKRDTVVLVVYDISEEDEALLDEQERDALADVQDEDEPKTTTSTTVVEEDNYQITTQQTGAGIPWSGGPIPEGYEGPVSNP